MRRVALWSLAVAFCVWLSVGSYRAGMRRADATIDQRGGMSPARVKAAREALGRLRHGVRE